MTTSERTRVLVVANRTAATPQLLEKVRQRAQERPCQFSLLIPDAVDRRAGDWTLETALPLLRRAAGRPVEGIAREGEDPFDAIAATVRAGVFDEIIISTLSRRRSRWLRRDLPRRLEGLGLPVTVVELSRSRGVSSEDATVALLGGVPTRPDRR
jgi:hypothetical protein